MGTSLANELGVLRSELLGIAQQQRPLSRDESANVGQRLQLLQRLAKAMEQELAVHRLTGFIAWLIRKLPATAKAWLDTLRVEQLLDRAIAYGLNSVPGAAKKSTLTVDVHLPVLAYVLQYALDRIPATLLKWVGGPTSLAEMIWSRLDVDTTATRPDLQTLADEIAAGSSVAVAVSTAVDGSS